MHNFGTLLTTGLVIGFCLSSALPTLASGTHNPVINTDPNADSLVQIQVLHQTDKELGDQLVSLKQSNEAQRTADWAQQKYPTLLVANSDQITQMNDYTTELVDGFNLEKDETRYK